MLTEQNIRDVISGTVEDFDAGSIGPSDDFLEAGLDSLDHATILLSIQEEYGLIIPDNAIDDCRSIEGILAYELKAG
ncbi:MAG: acyl carrier protein [Rhodospirillaceae bacterium]|nr:acyl carrier protein [Rhodospirillaceae bacterium]